MIYRKRYGQRRRIYKKRASGFKKAVSSIAKRVVNRQAETKTGALAVSVNFGTNGTLTDLWGTLAQGSGQNQRIGDQVHAQSMTFRGYVAIDTGVITGAYDRNSVRMLVVAGKRPLTNADFTSFSPQTAIDHELMTVLVDKPINFATTKTLVYFHKRIKLNRTFKYDSSGAITNRPVYLFVVPQGGTGILAGTGNSINFQVQRYFKDV